MRTDFTEELSEFSVSAELLELDLATSNRRKPGSFENRESSEIRSSVPCTNGISTRPHGPSGQRRGPTNSFFLPSFSFSAFLFSSLFLLFFHLLQRERDLLQQEREDKMGGKREAEFLLSREHGLGLDPMTLGS